MKNKNRYEIIIFGRGGQGAKTSAELLVQAALLEGKQVQAFPEFGPERSGAPVKSFVRIADRPIKTHQPVDDPDCVLVLDETLLSRAETTKNLTEKEPLIVNSRRDRGQLKTLIKSNATIHPVDASGMSKEIIGQERPNTVILGRFCAITGQVKVENVAEAFRSKYEDKLGKEITEKNVKAIKEAYVSDL